MSNSSPRRRARELVLQGLYERQLAGSPSDRIAADLAESHGYQRADQAYFAELWRGAAGDYDALLARVAPHLDRSDGEPVAGRARDASSSARGSSCTASRFPSAS